MNAQYTEGPERKSKFVRSTFGLADAFSLQASGEGIVTQAHLKELRLLGYDFGRGQRRQEFYLNLLDN